MVITELWRFPVKSMQGERVTSADITDAGVVGDRAFAVVDAADGRVGSAKNPRKWGDLLQFSARTLDDGAVEITLPDGTTARSDDGDVDARLSTALGRDVHLLNTAPQGANYEMLFPAVDGAAPEEFIAATRTGEEEDGTMTNQGIAPMAAPGTFFDVAPLHIVAAATLAAMDVDVRRLRPNVVVDVEGGAYVENGWPGKKVALGASAAASVLMPTMRCVMTTLAQPGLERDRGVLQRLVKANRVDIGGGMWAAAGVYATVASSGQVAVGDAVSVV